MTLCPDCHGYCGYTGEHGCRKNSYCATSSDTKTDREILIDYLMMKARQEDWHGVSDAANDLREMDASGKGVDKSAVSRWVEKALRGEK